MIILGTPAAFARGIARRCRLRACSLAVGAAACAAVALGWPTGPLSPPASPLRAVAATLAVVCLLGAERARSQASRASIGVRSERRVAHLLARTRGLAAVVHGALLGAGGDADHILLGPLCAVIETKTGRGPVKVTAQGRLKAGTRVIPGDPLAQARRQAAALSRRSGVPAAAVVCIPDATALPVGPVGGVYLCSLTTLAATLERLDRPLAGGRAVAIAQALQPAGV